MADFAPPAGPPPPKVPEGYKAIWNDQYKEWFYVNIYTKQSQWEKPTAPAYPHGEGAGPSGGAPPSYDHQTAQPVGPEKTGSSTGAAMFGGGGQSSHGTDLSTDEALARKLQEEENARVHGAAGANDRGEANSYYAAGTSSGPAQYGQGYQGSLASAGPQGYGQTPSSSESTQRQGLLGKLFGKKTSSQQQGYGYPPQQAYGQQQYYGGQPSYNNYGPQYAHQRPARPGMGAGGAAALGVGGGLLGGMMLGQALGGDGGDYGGGDGGDYGGGDFGGDFGGGDGGGGDFGGGDGGGGGD